MYIYQTGLIGEAVRAKIDGTKASVMGGADSVSSQSFGDLLRSMMVNTSAPVKPVGVTNADASSSPVSHADGRTLLYALSNADSDSTASAVVGALGLPIQDNTVKAAADGLSDAAQLLGAAKNADKATLLTLLSDFTDKYNSLITDLNIQTSATGSMYSRLFSTAANSAADALANAGITVGTNGQLTLDPNRIESVGIDGFLGSIATAANAVSSYASTITGSQDSSLLDFLGQTDLINSI